MSEYPGEILHSARNLITNCILNITHLAHGDQAVGWDALRASCEEMARAARETHEALAAYERERCLCPLLATPEEDAAFDAYEAMADHAKRKREEAALNARIQATWDGLTPEQRAGLEAQFNDELAEATRVDHCHVEAIFAPILAIVEPPRRLTA